MFLLGLRGRHFFFQTQIETLHHIPPAWSRNWRSAYQPTRLRGKTLFGIRMKYVPIRNGNVADISARTWHIRRKIFSDRHDRERRSSFCRWCISVKIVTFFLPYPLVLYDFSLPAIFFAINRIWEMHQWQTPNDEWDYNEFVETVYVFVHE